MREVYIVATEDADPLGAEGIGEAFETDDVTVELDESPGSFRLHSAEADIAVRFEALETPLGWTPELLTGSEAAHARLRRARGLYRVAYQTPAGSQPTVGVFEALWCARGLLERREGVLLDASAFKLHEEEDVREITELDFDIRDHVNLHAMEAAPGDAPLWVHSHGMAKFGQRDVEIFHLAEADLLPAESFLHELCTDLAFGEGPVPRMPMETSNGEAFMLVSSEEARHGMLGVPHGHLRGARGRVLDRGLSGGASHHLGAAPALPEPLRAGGPDSLRGAGGAGLPAPAGVQGPVPPPGADGAFDLPGPRRVRDPSGG